MSENPSDQIELADSDGDEVLFDAVITPHRSLSPRGFTMLMILIGAISFICGIAFMAAGAWPVVGFLGLDVLLVYLAFRLNYRSGRAVEYVKLTRRALIIRRFNQHGHGIEIEMQPYWLKVELAGKDVAEQIRLRSHGEIHTVGAFLSPAERVAFADALRQALSMLHRAPHLDAVAAPNPA